VDRCCGPRFTDIPLPPNAMLSRLILAAVGTVGVARLTETVPPVTANAAALVP
jgi:hypothetical protein